MTTSSELVEKLNELAYQAGVVNEAFHWAAEQFEAAHLALAKLYDMKTDINATSGQATWGIVYPQPTITTSSTFMRSNVAVPRAKKSRKKR